MSVSLVMGRLQKCECRSEYEPTKSAPGNANSVVEKAVSYQPSAISQTKASVSYQPSAVSYQPDNGILITVWLTADS
jgi:hypothetical protein